MRSAGRCRSVQLTALVLSSVLEVACKRQRNQDDMQEGCVWRYVLKGCMEGPTLLEG